MKRSKSTGILLVTFPVLIQFPYSMLIANFEYPQILRMPAATILERYAAGGEPLAAIWCGFALTIVPFLLAICLLPSSVPDQARGRWLAAATPLGVGSAIVQIAGLLRWVAMVPLLARGWVDSAGDAAARKAIEWVFLAQHQLFGVLLGEHLGQMLLGLWTLGVSMGFPPLTRTARWSRWLGFAAGGMFVAGSVGNLAAIFPSVAPLAPLATVAFLMWSVWCFLLGVALLRLPAERSPSAFGR